MSVKTCKEQFQKSIERESRLLKIERTLRNNNFPYNFDLIKHTLAEIRQERELIITRGIA